MAEDLDAMAVFAAVAEPVLARLSLAGFLEAHLHGRRAALSLGVHRAGSERRCRLKRARRPGAPSGRAEPRLSTDSAVNIRLARDGLGLTIVYEDQVRDLVARGELVPVLAEFCTPFPGYYLYYPERRHASPALRAFIDHLRQHRLEPSPLEA